MAGFGPPLWLYAWTPLWFAHIRANTTKQTTERCLWTSMCLWKGRLSARLQQQRSRLQERHRYIMQSKCSASRCEDHRWWGCLHSAPCKLSCKGDGDTCWYLSSAAVFPLPFVIHFYNFTESKKACLCGDMTKCDPGGGCNSGKQVTSHVGAGDGASHWRAG